ncbi:MAG: hypothetical protein ACYDG2_14380 [Ruminiclostridium sp.]
MAEIGANAAINDISARAVESHGLAEFWHKKFGVKVVARPRRRPYKKGKDAADAAQARTFSLMGIYYLVNIVIFIGLQNQLRNSVRKSSKQYRN